jgi:hypothetical protein
VLCNAFKMFHRLCVWSMSAYMYLVKPKTLKAVNLSGCFFIWFDPNLSFETVKMTDVCSIAVYLSTEWFSALTPRHDIVVPSRAESMGSLRW